VLLVDVADEVLKKLVVKPEERLRLTEVDEDGVDEFRAPDPKIIPTPARTRTTTITATSMLLAMPGLLGMLKLGKPPQPSIYAWRGGYRTSSIPSGPILSCEGKMLLIVFTFIWSCASEKRMKSATAFFPLTIAPASLRNL